uniref:Glycoprotein n=1 Tax=Mammarenavirus lujoense TaxID=3052314 RepID=UPI0032D6DB41
KLFQWSLSDETGSPLPGGHCLERWLIFASDIKCFDNAAIAKCNKEHDEEFCDMLRLFDYNKASIAKLRGEASSSINLLSGRINAIISDTLLMRSSLKRLMGIPYCNYTKFWYLNHTKLGIHSLPRCWLVSNGSYLNETKFTHDMEDEADKLLTEMLKKEYVRRQEKTPITLMDILMFSVSFYMFSVTLCICNIPTHRHITGLPCPKPHRLRKNGTCACGFFKSINRSTGWAKHGGDYKDDDDKGSGT